MDGKKLTTVQVKKLLNGNKETFSLKCGLFQTLSVCLSVALLKAFALKILRLVFGAIIGWMNWVFAGLNTKCELNADHVTSLMCIRVVRGDINFGILS